jgi:hypothetical protein
MAAAFKETSEQPRILPKEISGNSVGRLQVTKIYIMKKTVKSVIISSGAYSEL